MLNSIEEHITILIYRSTYIFCLYRPVTGGHVGSSSSGGLGALPLGALPLGALPLGALRIGALPLGALRIGALRIGALPLGALPLGALRIGALPLGALPLGALPLGALRIGALPLGALPLGALRIGALPLGALPLGALRIGALPPGAFFLRISDLKADVFSCVDRLKRVLFACSEKGVCRQYRPSPLCKSCIYRLLSSMAALFTRIFDVTEWSVLLSFNFQMCSFSDVDDDLWLSLKCAGYIVF